MAAPLATRDTVIERIGKRLKFCLKQSKDLNLKKIYGLKPSKDIHDAYPKLATSSI